MSSLPLSFAIPGTGEVGVITGSLCGATRRSIAVSITSREQALALATTPIAAPTNEAVYGKRVSANAFRLGCIDGSGANATQHVFSVVNDLEMAGAHTRMPPTKVVKLCAVRNWPDKQCVRRAVGQHHSGQPRVPDHPVSAFGLGGAPLPAAVADSELV